MDYLKHYEALLERAQKRPLSTAVYYETHHIIPKCLGGSNEAYNLVKLTAKEHFFAHLLLTKIYPEEGKIHTAFWFMCNQRGRGRQVNRVSPSSRQYAVAKEAFIQQVKKEKTGVKNPGQSLRMKQNNPNFKPGVKEKQSLIKKGKAPSLEVREKISKALIGRAITWKDKISKTQKEKGFGTGPKTEEHKAKIAEALRGVPKPEYTCLYCGKTGKGASNMQRWHFENCKNKERNINDKEGSADSQAGTEA